MDRQYPHFHAICRQRGLQYKDLVAEFTGGVTDSLRALSDAEYLELFDQLKGANKTNGFTPKPGDAQRKKIIGIAKDMQWHRQGKEALMQRIDVFMLTKTKYKKRLNDLTVDELNRVCHVFEVDVKGSFYKALNK